MRPILAIELLGGLHLTYDGTAVTTLNAPNMQSLLVNLLLHRETPQSRQRIAFLLWPDSSEAQAQSNLRTLLRRLRQAWPAADEFLQVDNRTLRWRSDAPLTLDVEAFERAAERAQATGTRADLEQAISLYRGDLLPGCYDDWIQPERERLHQQFLQALTQLIQLLEAQRDYNAALVHAQRLLQLDPLQETTYQILMRLHAAHGDRANVVRTFHQCEIVLKQELGVKPSPETRELFEKLQQAAPLARATHLPPPATNNLPVPLTSFIGRVREMTEVKEYLSPSDSPSPMRRGGRGVRLLTLTGAGGSGKSRLALHVARDLVGRDDPAGRLYEQGVWWVELAPLSDPALVPQAVANILGIPEQPGRTLIETLADALKAKHLLLVLDNCEHLIQACATFASTLLHASEGLQILATSREALGISGETIYDVPPLALASSVNELNWQAVADSDASRLFIERAQAVLPTFSLTQQNATAVARVCVRLDGIPLAIELASARIKVLLVEQIAARLDDRFSLLTTGDRTALPRHQTLRAMIDWSHNLLSEPERVLFRRLTVFAGGWTLEAAEAVCAGEGIAALDVLDLLSHLLDKSLVALYAQAAEPRYRMLETIRQYAREKLQDERETERLRDQHLHFCLQWVELSEPMFMTGQRTKWLPRWDVEYDNLRAALAWACGRDPEIARWLAGLLCRFWLDRDHYTEAQVWYRRVLSLDPPTQTKNMARALLGAGKVLAISSAFEEALPLLEQSIALWKVLSDQSRMAEALHYLAYSMVELGRAEAVCALYEANESVFREFADPSVLAFALTLWGRALVNARGEFAAAKVLHEESLAVGRRYKDPQTLGTTYLGLGYWAMQQGDYQAARRYHLKSLAWRRQTASRGFISVSMLNVADVACLQGDYLHARALYAETLALSRSTGDQMSVAHVLARLGYLALHEGDEAQAATCFAESLEVYRERSDQVGITRCLAGYAELQRVQRRVEQAVQILAAGILHQIIRGGAWPTDRIEYERTIAAARAELGEATFKAAWAEGRALTLEQAIELALSDE